MTPDAASVQETYAPANACFGCGPANARGLRIRSMRAADGLVCDWQPEKHHEAFPGMLNGGIVGTLLDCHGNWTAAIHLMDANGLEAPPCTVTAEYTIKLLYPTPTAGPVHLAARVVESGARRAVVEGTLTAGGRTCATCRGTFVAVRSGHPAYHRW
jgi:acyl-coenzyme A thioesterase PaaI-like protein